MLRRIGLLIVLVSIFLALAWLCFFLKERSDALSTMDREISLGLQVEWKDSTLARYSKRYSNLTKYLPGTGPKLVHVEYKIGDGAELGNALRHFATAESVSIGYGSGESVFAVLSNMGKQRQLVELHVFNADLDNSVAAPIGRFSSLKQLSLVPGPISGETLSNLKELRAADLSYCPITDEGLRELLALPKIESLTIRKSKVSPQGVMQAVAQSSPSLVDVAIFSSGFSKEEIVRVLTATKASNPHVRMMLR